MSALWLAQTMKDPGGLQWLEQIPYSQPIYNNKNFDILVAVMTVSDTSAEEGDGHPRTELDSHANMLVVGQHAYILAELGTYVGVSPFTPHYKALRAPIVDAAVQYDSPYDGKTYILVLQNTIHVPLMTNNLLLPFMMREAGIVVRDMAKIHVEAPTVEDHSTTFMENGFRIPLSLWGVFSYFPTSKPMSKTLQNVTDVYIVTPLLWQPHSDTYAHTKSSMLDWEGNMRD